MKQNPRLCLAAVPLACAFALSSMTVNAQTPPPDAGRILDSVRPANPTGLPQPGGGLRTTDERKRVASVRAQARLDVKGFRVSGAESVKGVDAQALLAPFVGPQKSFDDIEQAAEALQTAIRTTGLFLAQVDVPSQKVVDGIVELRVMEGRIDKVELKPMPEGSLVSREAVEALLNQLQPGDVVSADSLERSLFLIGDLRGLSATSLVKPGSKPGTAIVEVEPAVGRKVQGNLDVDNLGSIYTGVLRVGASVEVNSPFGRGDLLKFSAQTTDVRRLLFLRGVYQSNVGGSGLKLGVAGSYLKYSLGTPAFSTLDAAGEAHVLSLFSLYPIKRGRNLNLFTQVGYDHRVFSDAQRAVNVVNDKTSDVMQFSIVGDSRDSLLGGGINSFQGGVTVGKLSLDTPVQLAADQAAGGRNTNGGFTKYNYALARQQLLWNSTVNQQSRLVLFGSLQGQFASKNLDSSEKMALGGPSGVRAYPQGEGAGDSGHQFTWELRKNLFWEGLSGDMVLSLFGDYGWVKLNHTPLATDTINTRSVHGHGFGLTWSQPEGWFVKTSVAWRGKRVPQADTTDPHPRIYIQASRQF